MVKKEKISLEKTHKASDEQSVLPVVETLPVAAPVVAPVAEGSVNKVGSLLKEMRLHKNLKLVDVAKKLCIRRFYLEAIEESRYRDIPEFPYGIGFIRSYADYLGLNSGNIIELYKEETVTKTDKDIFLLEPQTEATVPGKKYLLISLLALVLVYVLWSLYNDNTAGEPETPAQVLPEAVQVEEVSDVAPLVVEDYSIAAEPVDNKPAAEPLAVIDATQAAPEASNVVVTDQAFPGVVAPVAAPVEVVMVEPAAAQKKTVASSEAAAAAGGAVVIKVKGETWVEVKDKEHLYISKVLNPGDVYTLPADGKGMILSVGRPEAVEVLVNGAVTAVVTPAKKTNVSLDKFLSAANH